jgi:hypothetical protein
MLRDGAIILRDIVGKLDVLNIECDKLSCATGAPPQHSKPFFRRAFAQAPRPNDVATPALPESHLRYQCQAVRVIRRDSRPTARGSKRET